MPIVAVGVAIAADVAVGSAAIAGTVTALGVVAAVGATVSAIGAVTGVKALTYVGAGLGLIGGIGSLASAAGVLGDTAGLPGAAASTADAGTTTAAATGGDVISSFADPGAISGFADQGAAAASGSLDTLNIGNPAAAAGSTAASTADTATAGTGGFNGPPAGGGPDFVGLNNAQTAPAGTQDAGSGAPTISTDTMTDTTGQNTAVPPSSSAINLNNYPNPTLTQGANAEWTQTGPGSDAAYQAGGELKSATPAGDSGVLDGIMGFVQKNPMLAYGALSAGGQFLSGLTSTLTPAQVNALNAQAASNQATANLTARQTSNIESPRSVATLAPVTGQPGQPIVAAPTAGLINGAPQVNVTGVPA